MKIKLLILACTVSLTGCASIFSGTTETVTFNTTPSGANVELNGLSMGKTPLAMPVKRSLTPPTVQLKLDGYETRTASMQNSLNGISILNLACLPCWGVDALTGAMMKYEPANYQFELTPKTK